MSRRDATTSSVEPRPCDTGALDSEDFLGPDFLFPWSPEEEESVDDKEERLTFEDSMDFCDAMTQPRRAESIAVSNPVPASSGGSAGPPTPSSTHTAFSPGSISSSSSLSSGISVLERLANESDASKPTSTVQYLPVGMMMQGKLEFQPLIPLVSTCCT